MTFHQNTARIVCSLLLVAVALSSHFASSAVAADVVMRIVMVEDEDGDPVAAGKEAAQSLLEAMGDVALKAVIVSECFEDRQYKEELLEGLRAVLPDELIMGGSTYGSFTQQGCTDFDAVCLLGIGGRGIGVSAGLVTEMGTSKLTFDADQDLIRTRLHAAGGKLASRLRRGDNDKLLILMADAHSPKAQYLVEGLQTVVGEQFPITGGCANKNAGQTFFYFKGQIHEDAAIALMLSGDVHVALTGRQANENEAVIATANEGAAEALEAVSGEPLAVLAFNCAGRRSKLDDYQEELAAIQKAIGRQLPLFGCYCAGEIGPVDDEQKESTAFSGGSGWHVMFTVIGQ